MSHYLDLADHEIEHLAAELLGLEEEGRGEMDELRRSTRVGDLESVLARLVRRGLAQVHGGRIRLSPEGRELAEQKIRRHRLAELLLSTVLEVEDDRSVNRTACVIEHVLSPAVTDSVCSFLGHPKHCPHGKPIPAGPCCRAFSNAVEPLVQPLGRLDVGERARIVFIAPREPARLVRLSGLGLVPGATLRLTHKQPATVVAIGETTVALDPTIASEIYVKRLPREVD
jgi:DtxR family Mn-dependent transcriptional regulator